MMATNSRRAGGRGRRTGRGRWWRPSAAAALTLLLLAPGAGVAQRRGGPPPGVDREEMQRRIQARFGQIVRQQLGLDREQQQALAAVIRDSEDQRRELRQREEALRLRLRSQATLLPRAGGTPLLPDEEAREVLREMRSIREAERRLFEAEQERLLTVLTPGQLVRFYALREELAHRVERLRGPPGGPGGPGGGMGPPPRGR